MRTYFSIYIFITIVFFSCISAKISNYTFNQKTAAPQLQQDVILLKKILEANHPSLYWYTPKDSMDAAFNEAIHTIKDSLTEVEFRNKIANIVSKIRCGHTAVRFSKNYVGAVEKYRYPLFPLSIKTWRDSMVVLGSLLPRDSIFIRGTIITSINDKRNKELLDSMFHLISTDGYSNNFKSQVLSGNFPSWYKLAFGVDSSYTIGYIDNFGKAKTAIIKNYQPLKDTTKRKKDSPTINPSTTPVITKKPSTHEMKQLQLLAKRSLIIDSSINTAFLRVATFSSARLRFFFRQSLKTITQQHIKNVVIDLRENTGGQLESSTLLTKYFINKPFKTGDTVAAITKRISYKKYIPQAYGFWWPMQIFSRKMNDGRFHKRRSETHFYQPKVKNHFNGYTYLLQGGLSFSATTMFISNLKGQNNVTVVGEETGGGFYGNTAMFLPTVILPNSKLRLVLPLYHLVIDSNRTKDGRGIIPEVLIQPSSAAIKQGIDLKIVAIKEMIIKNKL